jgi:hypothetical protein
MLTPRDIPLPQKKKTGPLNGGAKPANGK